MEISITLMRLDLELVLEDSRRLLQSKKRLVVFWKIWRIEVLFLHPSELVGMDKSYQK